MTIRRQKNVIKMLILALGLVVFFGLTTIVSAAGRDIIGHGTQIKPSAIASADDQTSGQGSSSQESSQQSSQQGTSQQGTGQQTGKGGQVITDKTDPVPTGMMSQLYPFITMLSVNFLLVALFMHLRLNQTRYGRSQVYYREMEDFQWIMRHLND